MTPTLKHYSEFKAELEKYHVSESALSALEDIKLVLLIGLTSSGRGTILRHQVATGRYYYIVSDTTRPPRTNDGVAEQNGVEYWFRSEEEILEDIRQGMYLEAELIHGQQVSGISIRELKKAKAEGKIPIADVDLQGVHNIVKVKPDTEVIMIIPPSFEEWQRRLAKRGVMRPDEQRRRMETAQRILEDAQRERYYNFVISENVEQSAGIIDAIVEGKANPHQGRAAGIIDQIQYNLRDKLSPGF
jgi:guanylate kinase